MNHVLSGLNCFKCFVYLDDVVIYGYDLTDHNQKLVEVLQCFRNFNLKLQPTKCNFLRREIKYLGHLITSEGIKPDPRLIDSILKFPKPMNKSTLESFIGLTGYYRSFIKNYADIIEPLIALKRGNPKTFQWNAFADESFNSLKIFLTSSPILQFPDFTKTFYITTDASNVAIGAVLSQINNSEDLPIAFASRVLNKSERNYPTIKRELLAIKWAIVNRFRPYVYGRKFVVITDHKPLTYLFSTPNPNSILVRWRIQLEEFDFKIQYKPGKQIVHADTLSRIEIPSEINVDIVTRAQSKLNLEKIPKTYNSNQTLNETNNTDQSLKQNSNEIAVNSDLILNDMNQNLNSTSSTSNQINCQNKSDQEIITLNNEHEISQIIKEFHINSLGGHQGIIRTFNRIKCYYSFPKMLSRISKFIKTCEKCQRNKHGLIQKMPMKLTSTSTKPFERISLDIVGPLLPSYKNNKFILTLQDDLTKFSWAIPIPNQETTTVAKVFVENFICLFGCPISILTDQGQNFMSKMFKQVCNILKIKQIKCTAYHPQSNGALERSHKTLGEYLRNYAQDDPLNWDQWIPFAMFAYNTTPHTSTKYMPFELLFGIKPIIPNSLLKEPNKIYNYEDYSQELKYRLQTSWNVARNLLEKNKQKSKLQYDQNLHCDNFEVGDEVLLKNETNNGKIEKLWLGPYLVTQIISDENTQIKIKNKNKIVHNNRLKHFQRADVDVE